jgi:pimeloyl-ACP methyl ester carboxylesterase
MSRFSLAEISTKDGIIHQGIVSIPEGHGGRAVLWIHGLTARFYGDVVSMNLFADVCSKKNMGFASFNTRGHDMITGFHRTDVPHTYRTIGGGLEKFEESIHDIEAAVTYLTSQGFSEVVLVGHSTGANKACFYAATQNDPRVIGVVLSGSLSDRYSSGYTPAKFQEYKAFMEKQIAEGKGDEPLFGYDFFVLSANRWMSLYVEGSAEDVFNYHDGEKALVTFSQITKPLMVINGANDEHADMPMEKVQALFDAHTKSSKYKSVLVPDALHSFDGKESEMVQEIIQWVASL